jgi:hypothetical protein
MPKPQQPLNPVEYTGVERRRQSRQNAVPADWETIALQRVAGHVESLLPGDGSSPNPVEAHGWEQAALLALRRRLRQLKSD